MRASRTAHFARALVCAVAVCAAALATAHRSWAFDPDDIETATLANGMRVVLWPDHSIPNLAMYTFFRVGSRNERPGITGLSHFFEHMMFNGSKNYGPGMFDRTMEAAGGANNAFTEQDITVYQDWFPRSALETILKLEADRIGSLSFDSTVVESERGVVASERRRSVEDNNMRLLDEETWAAAYKAHPYQWPVIGWMVDIQGWKIDDLKRYFHTYYAPNNATLVLAGDFDRKEVLDLAKRYLEPLTRGPEPLAVTTTEPEQRGERRVTFEKLAEVAGFICAWHIPATSSPDYYPLRVLEALLLQGESSRLHRRLIERDQVALSVGGGFNYALDPTLFTVEVQVKQGVEQPRCEALVYDEIDRFLKEPPSDRELQKAKNQLAADFYRQLETISGQASVLGFSDVYFHEPKAFMTTVDKYNQVTPQDVRRMVTTYFAKQNRTVGVLVALSEGTQKTEAPAGASGSSKGGH